MVYLIAPQWQWRLYLAQMPDSGGHGKAGGVSIDGGDLVWLSMIVYLYMGQDGMTLMI